MMLSPAEGHQGHVDLTKDILYPDFLWALLSNSGSGSGPGSGFSGPWLKSSGLVSSGPGFCPASPGTRSGPWSLATGEGSSVDWTSSVWAGRSGGLCGSLNPKPQCLRFRPDTFPSMPCWYCCSSCWLIVSSSCPLRRCEVDLWSPMTRRPVCSFLEAPISRRNFCFLSSLPRSADCHWVGPS